METALTPVVGPYILHSESNSPWNSKHLQQVLKPARANEEREELC